MKSKSKTASSSTGSSINFFTHLDPKGRALEEFEKYDEDLNVNTVGPSTKVNLNVMTTKTTTTQETEKPKIIRATSSYSPSAYKVCLHFFSSHEINCLFTFFNVFFSFLRVTILQDFNLTMN